MARGGRSRILVAGAGAVGQFVGGRLHEAGHAVTLLTTQRHVDAFARVGLCVRGASNYCWDPEAVTALGAGDRFDAVLVTAKAYHTALLAPAVAHHLAPGGVAVTLQNGLGNWQKLAHHVPPARIAVASTSHGVLVEEPGKLLHAGTGATTVGAPEGQPDGAARQALALLEDAALEPAWSDGMRGVLWRKALVNHALNPVAALADVPNGEVLGRPDLLGVAKVLLREGQGLAARARVTLPPGDLEEAFIGTLERTGANLCSMVQDARARRPTEVEQISGRLVRLGEALLASMPRSDAIYGRLKDLEASYMGAEAATRMAWDELAWEREPF